MKEIAKEEPPEHVNIIVAWIGQFGDQVTFVARRHGNIYTAYGQLIGTPTHWDYVPNIKAKE